MAKDLNSLLFLTFFRITKSSRKTYFICEKLSSLKRLLLGVGLDIIFIFLHLTLSPAALLHPPCQEALGHIGLSKKDICREKIVLVTSAMSD
jgi:hypothetical protein